MDTNPNDMNSEDFNFDDKNPRNGSKHKSW